MGTGARQKSETYGRRAEALAGLYLQFCGYKILARREKTQFGEIDLILLKGDHLIFAEVKYRRDKSSLPESLTPAAQNRIIKAAHYITSRRADFQRLTQRFDFIFMAPLGPFPIGHIQHIKDGFRPY